MIVGKKSDVQSMVFSDDEMREINEMRKAFEGFTDRERFIVLEALKPYIYTNKMK